MLINKIIFDNSPITFYNWWVVLFWWGGILHTFAVLTFKSVWQLSNERKCSRKGVDRCSCLEKIEKPFFTRLSHLQNQIWIISNYNNCPSPQTTKLIFSIASDPTRAGALFVVQFVQCHPRNNKAKLSRGVIQKKKREKIERTLRRYYV